MRTKKQLQARTVGKASRVDAVFDETTMDFRNELKRIYDGYFLHEISDGVLLRRSIHLLYATTLKKVKAIQKIADPELRQAKMRTFIKRETELLKYAACRYGDYENPRTLTEADVDRALNEIGIKADG